MGSWKYEVMEYFMLINYLILQLLLPNPWVERKRKIMVPIVHMAHMGSCQKQIHCPSSWNHKASWEYKFMRIIMIRMLKKILELGYKQKQAIEEKKLLLDTFGFNVFFCNSGNTWTKVAKIKCLIYELRIEQLQTWYVILTLLLLNMTWELNKYKHDRPSWHSYCIYCKKWNMKLLITWFYLKSLYN